LGASDIHQRSNISSMRSFESRWGSPFSDGSAANAAEPIFFIFLERT
jgi:hypothetical protein